MNRNQLFWFNTLVGACDACTGLLLLIAPLFTLRLMGVDVSGLQSILLRFIGAFVFSVGVSYWIPFFSRRSDSVFLMETRMMWKATLLIRSCIASFVLAAVVIGSLSGAWLSVAIADGCIATIQFVLLQKTALRDDD